MRAARAVALSSALSLRILPLAAPVGATADKPLLRFSRESSAAQRSLEARFDEQLKAENLRGWMKRLSARPHEVSSVYGRDNAEFLAAMQKMG